MGDQMNMEENRLAEMTVEELLSQFRYKSYNMKEWAEIRRRLDRLVRYEAALIVAPHALDCPSLHETHLPGLIHYETDAGEPCPAYHFRRGKCNCYHAALEDR